MELNKMFFAYFFMTLNMPNNTIYVCHCFLFHVPQSILYYIPFHMFSITLSTKIVLYSKCPSNTFSNIYFFLDIFILVQLSF
jgi:hypothetical protein